MAYGYLEVQHNHVAWNSIYNNYNLPLFVLRSPSAGEGGTAITMSALQMEKLRDRAFT